MSEWISVEERLPELYVSVLLVATLDESVDHGHLGYEVLESAPFITIGSYRRDDAEDEGSECSFEIHLLDPREEFYVSHWMALPELPPPPSKE